MAKQDRFLIPVTAHDTARKLYAEMVDLAIERDALTTEYAEAVRAVEAAFVPRFGELADRVHKAKLQGSEAMCRILGIPYDSTAGYAIDISYIELGYAFLQRAQREDGLPVDMPPEGTKLN